MILLVCPKVDRDNTQRRICRKAKSYTNKFILAAGGISGGMNLRIANALFPK
jgi:hypothetical protein